MKSWLASKKVRRFLIAILLLILGLLIIWAFRIMLISENRVLQLVEGDNLMQSWWASKEAKGLLIAILFLILGLLIIWVFKIMQISPGDAVFVSMLLLPVLIYMIVSGKLSEFKAPGGLEAKFVSVANHPVEELASQRVEFVKEDMVSVPKNSIDELNRLERLANQSKHIILHLLLGQMHYNRQDAEIYLEKFLRYRNFSQVVFLDKKDRFVAFIPPWAMLRILQGEQGDRFIEIINRGEVLELLDFPGVMEKTVSTRATYKEALQAMADANLESILVVDEEKKVTGVIDRAEVLSKLMLAMAK